MNTTLSIQQLSVSVDDKEIFSNLSLDIPKGEVHAIMGPNGSGKSTLAQTLFGHPTYEVTNGDILFKGENLVDMTPDKRSHLGLFLAFQHPHAVPGVTIKTFLKQAINAKRRALDPEAPLLRIREYRELLESQMDALRIPREFADRYLNAGFSGGEKKKSEILQMNLLQPDIVVLDEIDSGLDVDALKIVAQGVNVLREQNDAGVLIITHYPRILNYIEPDHVHVMIDGEMKAHGDKELAHSIEEKGYDWIRAES